MNESFEAIYENGVLRPLKPIALREHEVVTVSVAPSTGEGAVAADIVAHQRDVLLAFVARMESLNDAGTVDGLSNRDHDRVIYETRNDR
jgi:predicted DNA-binding antitoxin AbrB/MazE fold protein